MINRIVISRLAVSCWLLGFAKIVLSFRTDVRNLFNYYIIPLARFYLFLLRSKIIIQYYFMLRFGNSGLQGRHISAQGNALVFNDALAREPCMGGIKKINEAIVTQSTLSKIDEHLFNLAAARFRTACPVSFAGRGAGFSIYKAKDKVIVAK